MRDLSAATQADFAKLLTTPLVASPPRSSRHVSGEGRDLVGLAYLRYQQSRPRRDRAAVAAVVSAPPREGTGRRDVVVTKTRIVRYEGNPVLVSFLAQLLREGGLDVQYERPEEEWRRLGVGSAPPSIAVGLAVTSTNGDGINELIHSSIQRFREHYPDTRVEIEHDDETEESDRPHAVTTTHETGPAEEDPLAGWDPRRRAALERLWALFAATGEAGASLSNELLAERRAEAEAEDRWASLS